MAKDAVVEFQVNYDVAKANSSLQELNKNTQKADKSAKSLGDRFKSVGKKANEVGKNMTTKFTLPIVAGLGVATKNASDLNEAMSATNFIFKDASKTVEKFAKTSAKTIGKSERAALDAVAGFGAMGTSMGQTEEAAADMGIELTKRAADLTSLRNLQEGVADTALKGIYTGETESLKGLGVVMTQTNLELFAVEKGMAKNQKEARKLISEMKQGAKVQLRYNFVMEKTAGAQGNFAETSDDMANSSRILRANLENASAELGENLLPIMTTVVNKMSEMVQWFGNLDESTQSTILVVLGIVAVLGPLALVFSKIIMLVQGLGLAFTFLAANPIVLVIGGIIVAIGLLIKNFDTVIESVKFLLYIFKTVFTQIGNVVGGILKGLGNVFIDIFNLIIGGLNSLVRLSFAPLNSLIKAANLIPGVDIPTLRFNIPNIPKLAIGTDNVNKDGLAMLHKGEQVVPADVVKGGYTNNFRNNSKPTQITISQTPINLVVNDETLVSAMLPEFSRQIMQSGGNI